ncbi:MAG: hypothetical protein MI922_05590, partial [Bacteroidales bacterium]|nr:hypothetical protein [Bacteroidales bacterium]
MNAKFKIVKTIIVLFAVFVMAVTQKVVANQNQYDRLRFVQLTLNDGLPYPLIREIAQDSKGLIWITTQSGVFSYDGYNFKSYLFRANDPNSIGHPDVESVYLDSKNTMWFGSRGRINRYNSDYDNFQRIYLKTYTDKPMYYQSINCMIEDANGTFWIGSMQGILKVSFNDISAVGMSFEHYCTHIEDGRCNYRTRYMFVDNDSVLWAGTEKGLFYYNAQVDSFMQVRNKLIDNLDISSGQYDDDGTLWLGSMHGLYKVTNLNTKQRTCSVENFTTIDNSHIKNVNTLLLDRNKALWIGTSIGLYILSPDNTRLHLYRTNRITNTGLTNDIITDLFMDNAGLIWIGTREGITIYDPYHYKFELYNSEHHPELFQVHGLVEDVRGYVWITTNKRGVFVLDLKANK